jgi:hypothetical protein
VTETTLIFFIDLFVEIIKNIKVKTIVIVSTTEERNVKEFKCEFAGCKFKDFNLLNLKSVQNHI